MILVNGAPGSEIPATDRGLAYGDGVFRTFPARSGKALHWARQYAKLAHDCAALDLTAPAPEALERDVAAACGGTAEAAVKVIVTRGAGERGYRYRAGGTATTVVIAAPPPARPPAYRDAGVRARLCSLRLSHQPALAGVKHLNRLENVLARAEWRDEDVAEGILCDMDGNVIGGTMTNLFVARRGSLATPALDRCGVAGVTRGRVLEAAARLGLRCSIERLSWDDVIEADEIFLVNSLAGVWPVRELEGRRIDPGALTRRIRQALNDDDDAQVD